MSEYATNSVDSIGDGNHPENDPDQGTDSSSTHRWRPLNSWQRRVIGVLIEKAKTTPDNYPLTVNSIVAACNQKSNRDPQMNIAQDDTELTLDELRELGLVVEVHGGGRVARYRHLAYEWFGVNKSELAVLAELLLRGEQTVGELRGRAARMEPIADLATLKPILDSMIQKQLVIAITPPGRGQIVTHGVFLPDELEQIKQSTQSISERAATTKPANVAVAQDRMPESNQDTISELRQMVLDLTHRVQQLENELGIQQQN